MTLLAARKYLFSDISETNTFLLCVFPLILYLGDVNLYLLFL